MEATERGIPVAVKGRLEAPRDAKIDAVFAQIRFNGGGLAGDVDAVFRNPVLEGVHVGNVELKLFGKGVADSQRDMVLDDGRKADGAESLIIVAGDLFALNVYHLRGR